MVCIVCPKGCRLEIEEKSGEYKVRGNLCPRGETYAISELTNPMRTLTSTVKIKGGMYPRLSVKSHKPIAKGSLFEVMELLNEVELTAPIKRGQIVIENVCGSEANIIATSDMKKL